MIIFNTVNAYSVKVFYQCFTNCFFDHFLVNLFTILADMKASAVLLKNLIVLRLFYFHKQYCIKKNLYRSISEPSANISTATPHDRRENVMFDLICYYSQFNTSDVATLDVITFWVHIEFYSILTNHFFGHSFFKVPSPNSLTYSTKIS